MQNIMTITKNEEQKVADARVRAINRVTIKGSIINVVLLIFKFVAGIVGGSAAMIADAVHSLSDFLTDVVVVVFVRLGSKPEDGDHDYGHGKYETLATAAIGMALFIVGAMLCYGGGAKIVSAMRGEALEQPGWIALAAALMSIALKEWAYRFTVSVGRRLDSPAVVANAWHHRSDALSSIGTAIGIGGAIILGERHPPSAHTPHRQPHRHRDARAHAGSALALRSPSARHSHRAAAEGAVWRGDVYQSARGAGQGQRRICEAITQPHTTRAGRHAIDRHVSPLSLYGADRLAEHAVDPLDDEGCRHLDVGFQPGIAGIGANLEGIVAGIENP